VSINLAGREATGQVPPAEFESTRTWLAEQLLAYRDEETGEPVVRRVIKREDYFSGPYAAEAPDLVLEFHEGFAHNNATGTVMFRWQYCQGVHSLDGIIVGLGPSFRSGAAAPDAHITDVAPTVLSLLGVPYPEETDGRVAEQLLAGRVEAQAAGSTPQRSREPGAYSEEEEARVRERLRGLGYIE
jgi:predicted AlkP superfamily phosphohydrolase/phosphomutase